MVDFAFSSDLTDAEWILIEPLLPRPAPGRPAGPDLRVVIDGIFFLLRSGVALRTAPPWSTAEGYYAQWRADGTWDQILATLQGTRPPHSLPPDALSLDG